MVINSLFGARGGVNRTPGNVRVELFPEKEKRAGAGGKIEMGNGKREEKPRWTGALARRVKRETGREKEDAVDRRAGAKSEERNRKREEKMRWTAIRA